MYQNRRARTPNGTSDEGEEGGVGGVVRDV